MMHVCVLGAGIAGITTAYTLQTRGYRVTVLDRLRYPAMDTSFANGGQLSASNAEVWNHPSTFLKALRWLARKDAPLLLSPTPSWHKYSWLGEFILQARHYRANTVRTTRMAIAAREYLFSMAERENIDFDLGRHGILHIYRTQKDFAAARKANALLREGGLERYEVTAEEIRSIEPALQSDPHAGFYTPSDATGDIHKFTRGLADACKRHGTAFLQDAEIVDLKADDQGVRIYWHESSTTSNRYPAQMLEADAVVVCAGVGSRALAARLGDRLNIYPVKGYSITVHLDDESSQASAPQVSLLDEQAKIVTSRLGPTRFRVAGTAELNGVNRDIRHDRVRPLADWVKTHFSVPTDRIVPWAGLRPMTPDMMPRVGPGRRPRVYYNTGHGHLGWTLSGITAHEVAEAISMQH